MNNLSTYASMARDAFEKDETNPKEKSWFDKEWNESKRWSRLPDISGRVLASRERLKKGTVSTSIEWENSNKVQVQTPKLLTTSSQ